MDAHADNLSPARAHAKCAPAYASAFAAALGVYIAGVSVQLVSGARAIPEPAWPANIIILAAFVILLIAAHVFAGKTAPVRFLRSVPVAISAIALVLAQAVFMGSIRQSSGAGLFGDILHSWPFALTMLYFLTNLGLAALGRVYPFRAGNIGFLLNHLGLWIALAAGLLGSGDLARLRMQLAPGHPEWRALDSSHGDHAHVVEMPFAFELKQFEMDVFPAKIALLDTATNKLASPLEIPAPGATFTLGDWNVTIEQNLSESSYFSDAYHTMPGETGTVPAARVSAKRNAGRDGSPSRPPNDATGAFGESALPENIVGGWISCGNFANPPAILELGEGLALAMPEPEAKRYASRVEVFTDAQERFSATIEVNKPLSLRGWKIYQLSYDERRGRWSQISIVELVRDPWLPAVYTGVFMMMAGAVFTMARMRKANA
ncbi:hypothetical protein M2103_000802 [Ereboglobus sp. PH5-5]|uniref:cytochrome c biogenesis protein ResB n=1 Tax=Ereboglobus sp. PH5-5 TaxID=2940529 RepID=UPI002405F5B4|nr:cytochrome c biogenesis protein ResB [Ereboglobus sp. PH5-5]MDF9832592.1 hypothetical protein [Ereboglobus sp. PH5-5]